MEMRNIKPNKGNLYYVRKVSGGYNPCIAGKPTDPDCDVLANCVGYAVGRFNEIGGYKACKYLGNKNAEDFVTLAKSQGLQISPTPTLGGCMVWSKGKTGDSTDGAGHVAIVEEIHTNGSITTSESGYGSTPAFWTKLRSGVNWGQSSAYTFLGCIVHPDVTITMTASGATVATDTTPEGLIRKGDRGDAVTWLQTQLAAHGYLRDSEIDGIFGKITLGALLAFQMESGLTVDGVCGKDTKSKL